MGVLLDGWAGSLEPTIAPGGERVHLALEVRRLASRREPSVRRLEDRINGFVHLPDGDRQTTHADLDMAWGETTRFPAGELPDGREVVLHVRVTR